MPKLICEGCAEPIDDDESHVESNGEDWHQDCFESSNGPKYCCGIMYSDGEDYCRSCGDPL